MDYPHHLANGHAIGPVVIDDDDFNLDYDWKWRHFAASMAVLAALYITAPITITFALAFGIPCLSVRLIIAVTRWIDHAIRERL